VAYHYLLILYDNYTLLGVIYFSLFVNHSAFLSAQGQCMCILDIQSSALQGAAAMFSCSYVWPEGLWFFIMSHSSLIQLGNWNGDGHYTTGNAIPMDSTRE